MQSIFDTISVKNLLAPGGVWAINSNGSVLFANNQFTVDSLGNVSATTFFTNGTVSASEFQDDGGANVFTAYDVVQAIANIATFASDWYDLTNSEGWGGTIYAEGYFSYGSAAFDNGGVSTDGSGDLSVEGAASFWSGSITLGDNSGSAVWLNNNGAASFANGNIVFDTDGSAYFAGNSAHIDTSGNVWANYLYGYADYGTVYGYALNDLFDSSGRASLADEAEYAYYCNGNGGGTLDFINFFNGEFTVNGGNSDFLLSNGAADNLTLGGNPVFSSGFTGTGSYTNFTIANGIITGAS